MTLDQIYKKPAKLFLTQVDTSKTVLKEDQNVGNLFDLLSDDIQENETKRNFRELLIVIIDGEDQIKAVITIENVVSVIDFIKHVNKAKSPDLEEKSNTKIRNQKLSSLMLEKFASPNSTNTINQNDDAKKLFSIFDITFSESVAVKDENNKFIGKITKNGLRQMVEILVAEQ